MTQPNRQDDDLQPLLSRLDEEFGPRREHEEAPIYGEARPIPPQPRTYRLSLPLGRAWAVWVLLALNITIYIIPALLDLVGIRVAAPLPIDQIGRCLVDGPAVALPASDYVFLQGAKINCRIADYGEYYRFLTSMFLHGGLLHIGFNAWALFSLGPEAERIYGTPRFLALYFIAGLAGGVASYTFSAALSVGASGAVFGLIGGLAAFYYTARGLLGEMSRQQLGSLITVIMINLFIGFSTPRIDNAAHIGGLVAGAAVGWLLAPRFAVDERLYPPQLLRRGLALAWPGALALLALLVFLVMTINPPIQ